MTAKQKLERLLGIAWKINDRMLIDQDGSAWFTGSQNLIEELRECLHEIDPRFDKHAAANKIVAQLISEGK